MVVKGREEIGTFHIKLGLVVIVSCLAVLAGVVRGVVGGWEYVPSHLQA